MAMMELSSNNPIQHNLRSIYKAGERARDLVKQILTFARKREEEKAPIKISTIVKEVIRFLRSTIPSTIDIQHDFRTEKDIVLADPTQMNQIVMNLCTNAAHAMREKGGVLEVGLFREYIGPDEIKRFIGLGPGHYVRLTVTDSGPGIPFDIIDKIFEPYFTTKDPGEGTGMGLAVVHGIVQNYGGDIAVESKPGKGTTFHVLLPCIEAEAPLARETKIELPKGKEHILLIDDEKVIVDIIQSMLENLGYKITARTSSIEALEAFRNKPEKYDLVITDMTMPNMTGKDLAKELMAIRSDIPIILCTGFSEQIDEIRAKGMGIRAFIMKPVIARDIANTIREVLDRK
jgi:CheY-like chemotaxis protein